MAIVSNANEEHQFVFAVNTISMVKNDALFSYVAPSNIFAWTLTPLMYCLPFRTFIKVNRTVIKITHFVLLFGIYAYEKTVLASSVFEPTDLIEHPAGRKRLISFQDKSALFSPRLNRQESVAGFQKDTALSEVFRLAPRPTMRGSKSIQTNTVVKNWMDQGSEASPPQEQDRSIVDRLEQRRRSRQATMRRKRAISGTRSVASDPAEFMSSGVFHDQADSDIPTFNYDQADDADGDDELVTNDDFEEGTLEKQKTRSHHPHSIREDSEEEEEDYFQTPNTTKDTTPRASHPAIPRTTLSPPKSSPPRHITHNRVISSATILYNPTESSASPPLRSGPSTTKGRSKPPTSGNRTPRPISANKAKPRPILPARQDFQSMPNFNFPTSNNLITNTSSPKRRPLRSRRSSLEMGMSDLGLDNLAPNAMVPSSFATQMANFGGRQFGQGQQERRGENTEAMMGRLMLARMKTLEEGFADVVREFREMGMRTAGNSVEGSVGSLRGEVGRWKGKEREKEREREREVGRKVKKEVKKTVRRKSEDVDVDGAGYFRDSHADGGQEDISERDGGMRDGERRYVSKGSSL